MAGAAAAGYASDDSPNLALVYTSRHPLHERTLLRGRREVYKRAEVAGALVHLIDRDQGDSGGGGGGWLHRLKNPSTDSVELYKAGADKR